MSGSYDEFGMFRDNAADAGLEWPGDPVVQRIEHRVSDGRMVSAVAWGESEPDLVLVHGGAQNAHTWDTVALAMGRPLLAVDLPGHGHSAWRDDHAYSPHAMADDLAEVLGVHAPNARLVAGMSLGGMTSLCLAANHPHLVPSLALVDVTPGVDHAKAEPIIEFVSGPEYFESFQEILDRTMQYNPTRSESSLRRGILHNAHELSDGRWSWRWDPVRNWKVEASEAGPDFTAIWEMVDRLAIPLVLYRGADSGVVGQDDVEELLRRKPDTDIVVVEGAGHSIQGDKPLELASLLASRLEAR